MSKRSRRKYRSKQTAIVNRPATQPSQPSDTVPSGMWWVPRSNPGTVVNHNNALFFSAVWSCVRVISETIAALPWRVMKRLQNGGKEADQEHPIDWLLHKQANPEMSGSRFKRQIAMWVTTWGNAYAEIERDRAGRVQWLWPIAPDRVTIGRDGVRGEIVYEVKNFYGEPSLISYRDMLHFTGIGHDGLVGYDVIQMAARTIGLGLDMEADARSFWANDSTPSGILKHPGTLGKEGMDRLRTSWEKIHGGPGKKGKVAILEEDMSFEAIGRPQRDSQFHENRMFGVLEVCRFFRVPPHKIYELSRATWQNIEPQEIEYMVDSILPWCVEFEQEADLKLFGIQQRGTWFTKFNVNARMRGDSAARASFYKTLANLGAFSVNDVLELEDMNQIGEIGEKRLVQINQTTLEKIGEEPIEPAQPTVDGAQSGGDGEQGNDDGVKDKRIEALMPVIRDTIGRIVKREQHRIEDAEKRLGSNHVAFNEWLSQEFYPDQRKYAASQLQPLVVALGQLLIDGGLNGSLEIVINDFLQWHLTLPRISVDDAVNEGSERLVQLVKGAKA